MELSYYLRSHFIETHPFYHVAHIFVNGPDDLLGVVMKRRVLVFYDSGWVVESIKKGEMVDLGRYLVEFLLITEKVDKEGETNIEPKPDIITHATMTAQQATEVSQCHQLVPSSPPHEVRLDNHLLKYRQQDVDPSAFTSEGALRAAAFKSSILGPRAGDETRRPTPISSSRPIHSQFTPLDCVTGPSQPHVDLMEDGFIPFDPSSSGGRTIESSPPIQLLIPLKEMKVMKVRQFEKRLDNCPAYCDLEEMYKLLMGCEKGEEVIMGIEAGLLD